MGPIGFTEFLRTKHPAKLKWVIDHRWKYAEYNYRESYMELERLRGNL